MDLQPSTRSTCFTTTTILTTYDPFLGSSGTVTTAKTVRRATMMSLNINAETLANRAEGPPVRLRSGFYARIAIVICGLSSVSTTI